jgi:hypothetical protein
VIYSNQNIAGICKEMIVQEGEDKSDKRRKLVSKLVDIRLEMEQLRVRFGIFDK